MEDLYDAMSARAYGLALRILRDPTDADDAVHDAFLAVWHQEERLDDRMGNLTAYISPWCTIDL